jgi:hypothetical protein
MDKTEHRWTRRGHSNGVVGQARSRDEQYITKRHTTLDISSEIAASPNTISPMLHEHGIPFRPAHTDSQQKRPHRPRRVPRAARQRQDCGSYDLPRSSRTGSSRRSCAAASASETMRSSSRCAAVCASASVAAIPDDLGSPRFEAIQAFHAQSPFSSGETSQPRATPTSTEQTLPRPTIAHRQTAPPTDVKPDREGTRGTVHISPTATPCRAHRLFIYPPAQCPSSFDSYSLRMTTRLRSPEFPGAFAYEHTDIPAGLTIREWRQLDAQQRRRRRLRALWRRSR